MTRAAIARAADGHLVLAKLHAAKPKPEKQAKKPNNPTIDKAAILAKRGSMICDCGCGKQGHDLHHAFIGRKKGFIELDDERNLVLVNHDEHIAGKFDTLEWRKKFWTRQLKRYGLVRMNAWICELPTRMENRIDWL
jgi:hypothetical protein